MIRRLPIIVLLWAALPTAFWAAPLYPCYRLAAPPQMDGEVARDPAWQSVPGVSGFYRLGFGRTKDKQSLAYAAWDPDNLYVTLVCEEPDIGAIHPLQKEGGDLWLEDSIEIFVLPPKQTSAFHFIVNTAGARRAAEGAEGNYDWQAAVKRGRDEYSVELKLPFAVFEQAPSQGAAWRIAFCRNIFTTTSGGDKFTSWPALQSRFLEPANFARLKFRGAAPGPEKALAEQRKLNAAYRKELLSELESVLAQGDEVARIIEQTQNVAKTASRSATLRRAWNKARRLWRRRETASLAQLREATVAGSSAARALYDLKYEALMEQLFAEP